MNHSLLFSCYSQMPPRFSFMAAAMPYCAFRTSGIDHRRRFRHYFGSFMQETKKSKAMFP